MKEREEANQTGRPQGKVSGVTKAELEQDGWCEWSFTLEMRTIDFSKPFSVSLT